ALACELRPSFSFVLQETHPLIPNVETHFACRVILLKLNAHDLVSIVFVKSQKGTCYILTVLFLANVLQSATLIAFFGVEQYARPLEAHAFSKLSADDIAGARQSFLVGNHHFHLTIFFHNVNALDIKLLELLLATLRRE